MIRGMNTEELASGLGMLREIFGGNVESARRKGLVDGDIDTTDPGSIHAHVRHEIPARVGHCDIHRLADFGRFFFRRCNYFARCLQIDHCVLFSMSHEITNGSAASSGVISKPCRESMPLDTARAF
jgi:hypothetical protein